MLRVLTVLLAACAVLPGSAGAQGFAPHRALYDMSLRAANHDPSILSVTGEMMAEWSESCDGWTMEHRTALTIGVDGEEDLQVASRIATWEARDGLSYRFSVRNLGRDGADDRIEGSARLEGKGKGGVVRYAQPETRTARLPAGTIFPVAHSDEVLAAAGETGTSLRRTVFDGLTGDGLFEVNAIIGAPAKPEAAPRPAAAPVASLRSWPTQIAFYRYGAAGPEPDNEVAFRMYANGVADDMIIDFGQFRVVAVLKALELAPRAVCK
jgi:hypothetical protein